MRTSHTISCDCLRFPVSPSKLGKFVRTLVSLKPGKLRPHNSKLIESNYNAPKPKSFPSSDLN